MSRRAKLCAEMKPENGKRYPLNIRTTFEIRAKLEAAAAASGRSLTQEAEYRLTRSFEQTQFNITILNPAKEAVDA